MKTNQITEELINRVKSTGDTTGELIIKNLEQINDRLDNAFELIQRQGVLIDMLSVAFQEYEMAVYKNENNS